MNFKATEEWSAKWLKQPTTIHGVAALAAWGAGALAWHFTKGNMGAVSAASTGAFGLVCVGLNDATHGKMTDADKAVMAEAIEAATSGHLKDQLPKLIEDGIKAVVGTK